MNNGFVDVFLFVTETNSFGGQYILVSELMSDGISDVDLNGDWVAHYNRTTGYPILGYFFEF